MKRRRRRPTVMMHQSTDRYTTSTTRILFVCLWCSLVSLLNEPSSSSSSQLLNGFQRENSLSSLVFVLVVVENNQSLLRSFSLLFCAAVRAQTQRARVSNVNEGAKTCFAIQSLTFRNFIGATAAAVTERTTPLQLTNGIYVICLIDSIPWRRFYFFFS